MEFKKYEASVSLTQDEKVKELAAGRTKVAKEKANFELIRINSSITEKQESLNRYLTEFNICFDSVLDHLLDIKQLEKKKGLLTDLMKQLF
jgi:hypothetical protein